MAEAHPQARFYFLHGLERSLLSPEHRLSALANLNLHRDQMSTRLACPLVIWTTDDTLTELARHAPDLSPGGVGCSRLRSRPWPSKPRTVNTSSTVLAS